MEMTELLARYDNGQRVRERLFRHAGQFRRPAKLGTIEGTSLGGAIRSKPGGNRPMLNVHVVWDDGTETTTSHTALEVLDD
jgi:hypothetical protein